MPFTVQNTGLVQETPTPPSAGLPKIIHCNWQTRMVAEVSPVYPRRLGDRFKPLLLAQCLALRGCHYGFSDKTKRKGELSVAAAFLSDEFALKLSSSASDWRTHQQASPHKVNPQTCPGVSLAVADEPNVFPLWSRQRNRDGYFTAPYLCSHRGDATPFSAGGPEQTAWYNESSPCRSKLNRGPILRHTR